MKFRLLLWTISCTVLSIALPVCIKATGHPYPDGHVLIATDHGGTKAVLGYFQDIGTERVVLIGPEGALDMMGLSARRVESSSFEWSALKKLRTINVTVEEGFGWPFIGAKWYNGQDGRIHGGISLGGTCTAWLGNKQIKSTSTPFTAIPYIPVWRGALANAIIYASVCFVIRTSWSVALASRRRHLNVCTKCAYDLRGSPAAQCPECGWKTGMVCKRPAESHDA
jgi:hypothetical protein